MSSRNTASAFSGNGGRSGALPCIAEPLLFIALSAIFILSMSGSIPYTFESGYFSRSQQAGTP